MNTLSTTLSIMGHSFVWALLHSLWQALLIYAVLFVTLRAFPSLSARARYNLSFIGLSVLTVWFADTWVSQYHKLKGFTVYVSEAAGATGSAAPHALHVTGQGGDATLMHTVQLGLERYFPLIVLCYCIGLGIMLLRLLADFLKVKRLKSTGSEPANAGLAAYVQEWQERLGISRKVQLMLSARVAVPVMMGVLKPVILLPVATVNNLTTTQVEAILLHELAHIKRNDYLFNLFQSVVETVLFFNPFVWLISGMIRREREHCCDDMVVQYAEQPYAYATALASIQSQLAGHGFAQAATGNKSHLFNRIKRIMEKKNSNKSHSRTAVVVLLVVGAMFTAAMLTITPSFAQKAKKEAKKDAAAGSKVVKEKTVIVDEDGKRKETVKETVEPADGKDQPEDMDVKVSFKDGKYRARCITTDSDGVDRVVKDIVIATDDIADAMAEVHRELEKVDWGEVRAEIHKALDEVDRELGNGKLQREISREVRRDLAKSREVLDEVRRDMSKERAEMMRDRERIREEEFERRWEASRARAEASRARAAASRARAEAARARAIASRERARASADREHAYETTDVDDMLEDMERQGLIDKSGKYKVVKSDGKLYVNGTEQPESVYRKYRRVLDHDKMVIKGNKGSLSISINDK